MEVGGVEAGRSPSSEGGRAGCAGGGESEPFCQKSRFFECLGLSFTLVFCEVILPTFSKNRALKLDDVLVLSTSSFRRARRQLPQSTSMSKEHPSTPALEEDRDIHSSNSIRILCVYFDPRDASLSPDESLSLSFLPSLPLPPSTPASTPSQPLFSSGILISLSRSALSLVSQPPELLNLSSKNSSDLKLLPPPWAEPPASPSLPPVFLSAATTSSTSSSFAGNLRRSSSALHSCISGAGGVQQHLEPSPSREVPDVSFSSLPSLDSDLDLLPTSCTTSKVRSLFYDLSLSPSGPSAFISKPQLILSLPASPPSHLVFLPPSAADQADQVHCHQCQDKKLDHLESLGCRDEEGWLGGRRRSRTQDRVLLASRRRRERGFGEPAWLVLCLLWIELCRNSWYPHAASLSGSASVKGQVGRTRRLSSSR